MYSDESNSSTSNDSQPRPTRKSTSRIAKKSTGHQEMTVQPMTRRQAAVMNKEKNKFLGNFNPETSTREKKKLEKKFQISKKLIGCVNDHRGIHIVTGVDLCDCLEIACTGCFYNCKKCNSTKCGTECRTYRKVRYESIEYHGYNFVKKNPIDK